jgi:hypothetical protein
MRENVERNTGYIYKKCLVKYSTFQRGSNSLRGDIDGEGKYVRQYPFFIHMGNHKGMMIRIIQKQKIMIINVNVNVNVYNK